MVNNINSNINTPYVLDCQNKQCAPAKLESKPPAVAFNAEPDPNAKSPKSDIFKKGDVILPDDSKTNVKVAINNATSIPEYAVRGLRGDQNADFHERLTIAKVPYYLGGPVLVWCFSACKESVPKVKQMAAGVALYYVGKAIAAKTVDIPVKLLRGVNLDQNYRDVVDLSTPPTDGSPTKKIQYKKSLISCDWARTDLLYDKANAAADGGRGKNTFFDNVAKKMGVQEDLNDSDSSVRPSLTKLIVTSRAWKYALAVPFILLSSGMAANDAWAQVKLPSMRDLKNNVFKNDKISFFSKVRELGSRTVGSMILKPLKTSFVEFFKNGVLVNDINNPKGIKQLAAKNLGKATIFGGAAMILFANLNILSKTSLKKKDAVNVKWFADAPKPDQSGAKEDAKVQG